MDNKKGIKLSMRYMSCLFVTSMLLGGFMFLLSSCDQEGEVLGDSKKNPALSTDDLVTVNFTVGERGFDISDVVVRNTPPLSSQEIYYYPLSGELDGDLYMYAKLIKDDAPVKLRSSLLDPNTKLRIVAYANPGSGSVTKLTHIDYVIDAGQSLVPYGTPPMTVPSGNIMFVAYSFNDTITMSAFTDITAAIADRDLLWGDTTVTVGPGNTNVHILLDHLFSRIKLQASVNSAVGNIIDYIAGARFEHSFPTLTVRAGTLTPGTVGFLPFTYPSGSGSASIWNSNYHPVYTHGGPPSLIVDSVTIDGGTPYTGPWPVNYATPLVSGHEYTLSVYFTRTFFNVQASYTGARDNCGPSTTPGTATYTVPAGTYSSTVSQAYADAMAQDDIIQNAQTWINNNTTCTPWQLATVRPYTNPGTYNWTVPSNLKGGTLDVFLVGGGGGGGSTNGGLAGGGGGGGYTQTYLKVPVTPGQTIQIIIGAGGTVPLYGIGGDGGFSQFMNSSYQALGGKGGGSTGAPYWDGGAGGSGGGGAGQSGSGFAGFGGSDGASGTSTHTYAVGGVGQGTTTRDFGEPTGMRNAGGGGGGGYLGGSSSNNRGGISDYSQGSGSTGEMGFGSQNGGGGYGGGGGGGNSFNPPTIASGGVGGAGTVLIRYYY